MASAHNEDQTRRRLCTNIGKAILNRATPISHSKWQHTPSLAPPPTPTLPYGDLWSLVNHIKVMHQYTELLSEAASGKGPHAPLLSGSKEMCGGPLQWFQPLCQEITPLNPSEIDEYQRHMDIWRQVNPGLFSNPEAAYHVHQSYSVEDRNMTRYLVSLLNPHAKEYEVDIAGNMLRARPASYDEFQQQFSTWRDSVLYHPLCLAARNMPRAEQWVPELLLHEADSWQELLDMFNRGSHCSGSRLTAICEALADRSPMFNNFICDLLDRVAVLTRVKSNCGLDSPILDDYLPMLQFPKDEASPYTHCLMTWNRLRQIMENAVPPSLLCPSVHPPSRGTWGYQRLLLAVYELNGSLQIQPSPLTWIDKDSLGQKELIASPHERLYDILFRLGEAVTSPEMAHLMLDPKSLNAALAGEKRVEQLPDYSDRKYVIEQMGSKAPECTGAHTTSNGEFIPFNAQFIACLNQLVKSLPASTERQFRSPQQFIAWRIDNPPRAILYHGAEDQLDLSAQPPHALHKSIGQDKVSHKTVSGISILNNPVLGADEIHTALRACIAEEVVGAHPDFADHPHHKTAIRTVGKTQEILHTTTLAEAAALFTGPLPEKFSEVSLHSSAPWSEGHIDTRYAERQTGDNGSRLRDWAAVYMDQEEIQRCRMAAHEIRCGKVYETHFPLASNAGQTCWVSVASSIPTETRVLRHLGGRTNLEVLKRAVENRYMHDGKLLPVRDKHDTVTRDHMEIYSDEKSGHVMLAYAPVGLDGKKAIEFMTFKHC